MSYYSASPTNSQSSYYIDGVGSRPASTSPTFANSALVYKFRQDACRGFDADDDIEFCPALTEFKDKNVERPAAQAFVPPVAKPAVVRPRRALEIIDPATGLRVSSPKPKN